VIREGQQKPLYFELTRDTIAQRVVKWSMEGDVAVLRLARFTEQAYPGIKKAIADIYAQNKGAPKGIILDLRNNPGGLVDQAVYVSDAFLKEGAVVLTRGRSDSESTRYDAKPDDLDAKLADIPLVVLINGGSASAAEIVAGALQDQHRALVLGEQSFGKGSVQTLLPLTENTALRLTTARYYLPSGRSVQEGGIKPDLLVPELNDPDYKTRPILREADLRRHLINEAKVDDKILEEDAKTDPRFAATPAELEKKGIKDFQLDYAVGTIARLATVGVRTAANAPRR